MKQGTTDRSLEKKGGGTVPGPTLVTGEKTENGKMPYDVSRK